MITQEIKIHDEPQPTYNYSPPTKWTQHNLYGSAFDDVPTEAEYQMHLKMARERFKIGSRYKYKTSTAMIEIIGFETDIKKTAIYGDDPGVILGKRVAGDGEYAPVYNYSISEMEDMLEIIA